MVARDGIGTAEEVRAGEQLKVEVASCGLLIGQTKAGALA